MRYKLYDTCISIETMYDIKHNDMYESHSVLFVSSNSSFNMKCIVLNFSTKCTKGIVSCEHFLKNCSIERRI